MSKVIPINPATKQQVDNWKKETWEERDKRLFKNRMDRCVFNEFDRVLKQAIAQMEKHYDGL